MNWPITFHHRCQLPAMHTSDNKHGQLRKLYEHFPPDSTLAIFEHTLDNVIGVHIFIFVVFQ